MKRKNTRLYGDVFFKNDSKNPHRSMAELFALLNSINLHGSISKGAGALGFSYRHSWNLIKAGEAWFKAPLLETSIGGQKGGGALLTGRGRKLLAAFIGLSSAIDTLLKKSPFYYKEEIVNKDIDPAPVFDAGVYNGPSISNHEKQPKTAYDISTNYKIDTNHLILATTMEPVETGLLDMLEEHFFTDTGIRLRHVASGSGQALAFAAEGRVDLTLTHAPHAETDFLSQDLGTLPLTIMSDPFIVVGPDLDTAGPEIFHTSLQKKALQKTGPKLSHTSTTDLFYQIAQQKAPFLSRGDGSGTHLQEQHIWNTVRIKPHPKWYKQFKGQSGNIGLLHNAAEMGAYCLVDKASFILFSENQNSMQESKLKNYTSSYSDDPLLSNSFQLIIVNPKHFPFVHHQAALQFRKWMINRGKNLIKSFGIKSYGGPLFSTD